MIFNIHPGAGPKNALGTAITTNKDDEILKVVLTFTKALLQSKLIQKIRAFKLSNYVLYQKKIVLVPLVYMKVLMLLTKHQE